MEPLVSIITPCYNHSKYLDDYFHSIINQTYKNIELILIDDSSKDNSVEIINKWLPVLEKRFENVVFIAREENKGLIFNCNEGLNLSRGKYVCLFASDDMMLESNIEEKIDFLENNKEYGFVYSDTFVIDDSSSFRDIKIKKKYSDVCTMYSGYIFQKLIDLGNFIPALSVVARKNVIKQAGEYSNDYIFEDYYMWLRISRNHQAGFINKPLTYYRESLNSITRNRENSWKLVESQLNLLQFLKESDPDLDISIGMERIYKEACAVFFRDNMKEEFLLFFNKIKKKDLKVRLKYLLLKLNIHTFFY